MFKLDEARIAEVEKEHETVGLVTVEQALHWVCNIRDELDEQFEKRDFKGICFRIMGLNPDWKYVFENTWHDLLDLKLVVRV